MLAVGIDAGLHVVRAATAGLQRVNAHDLILAQPARQRFSCITPFELVFARSVGHEAEYVACLIEEVGERRHGFVRLGRWVSFGDTVEDRTNIGRQRWAGVFWWLFEHVIRDGERLLLGVFRPAKLAPLLDQLPIDLLLALEIGAAGQVIAIGRKLRFGQPLGDLRGNGNAAGIGDNGTAAHNRHRQCRNAYERTHSGL